MGGNQIKQGIVLSYVMLFLGVAISFFYTPLMLRLLGNSEYGLFSMANALVGYLSIVEFGLGNALIRYTAEYRAINDMKSQYKLCGLFFLLYSILAIVTLIIGIGICLSADHMFSDSLTNDEVQKFKVVLLVLLFNLGISLPANVFSSFIIAYEKFAFLKTVQLISTILQPMSVLFFLFQGHGVVAIAAVGGCITFVSMCVNVIYCFRFLHMKFVWEKFEWAFLKKLIYYTSSIFWGIIFDKIFWNSPPFILGSLLGTKEVAVYSVGAVFGVYYMSLAGAITGVYLPKITSMVTLKCSSEELSKLFIKMGRILFIILAYFLLSFIFFGEYFITLWAGESYTSAFPIAAVLMISLTVAIIQSLGLSILQAKNKQGFRNKVYFIIALLNLLGGYLVAPRYGALGCAIVSSIVQFLGPIILMNVYYYKIIHIDIPLFWKEISRICVPLFFLMLLGGFLNCLFANTIYGFFAKIFVFTIGYLFLMWRYGMNLYERNVVMCIWYKIDSKIKLYVSKRGRGGR